MQLLLKLGVIEPGTRMGRDLPFLIDLLMAGTARLGAQVWKPLRCGLKRKDRLLEIGPGIVEGLRFGNHVSIGLGFSLGFEFDFFLVGTLCVASREREPESAYKDLDSQGICGAMV